MLSIGGENLIKKKIFLVGIPLFCVSFLVLGLIFYQKFIFKKNETKMLEVANELINQDEIESVEKNQVLENEDVICSDVFYSKNKNQKIIGKIIIKKLEVEAPIVDGSGSEQLKLAVGHIEQTDYWNGNVCLASHNRGAYAHYFKNLNKLDVGDVICYQTSEGTREYYVESIKEIEENNVSVLGKSEKNKLTLITCITGKKSKRLCVNAIEKL